MINIEKINKGFSKFAEKLLQNRLKIIIVSVLAVVIMIFGLKYFHSDSSFENYFMEDDPMLVKTKEFERIFGNDSYVAVLVSCEDIFTKENLSLIRELSEELLDSITFAEKITSVTNLEFLLGTEEGMEIVQIVPEEIPSDKASLDEIRKKAFFKPELAKRLISSDARASWIVLKLRPFPNLEDWKNENPTLKSPGFLTGAETEKVVSKAKYSQIAPISAGMTAVNYKKMEWLMPESFKIMLVSMTISVIFLIITTLSFRGVVLPILGSFLSISCVYGIVGYTNIVPDSGMLITPFILAFAVSIAYNIHFFTYFKRQFRQHGKRKKAVVETVTEIAWPIIFSGLTTVAALLSFLFIKVKVLHFVGFATSMAVLFTLIFVIVIFPIVLSFGKDRAEKQDFKEKGASRIDLALESFGGFVLRKGKLIIFISILIGIFFIVGIFKLEISFDIERTVGRRVAYAKEILEMSETELGSMYSYDLLIEFPNNDDAKNPENLKKLDSLSQYINEYPLTKRTSSVLNIIKDLNCTLNGNDQNYYVVPEEQNQVAQLFLLYENAGGSEAEYWIDYDYKRLRIMTELNNYNAVEAERELADLTSKAQESFPDAIVQTVGSLPQFSTMMQYVSRGQIVSFLIALGIIAVLLMSVFGSWRIGLIGLIPNIAPAIVVGGLMGWLDIPLDMVTATLIPMILGLAVDDTIHFINHGRLEFERVSNYNKAIKKSFRIVGLPLIITTIIICANFSSYMISLSNTFFHMGLLSICGMLAALLADLCITPIIFRKFAIFGKEKKVKK